MTGKFTAMSVWAFSALGPAMPLSAPERSSVNQTCIAIASISGTIEVDARYGLSKERMACGMGQG